MRFHKCFSTHNTKRQCDMASTVYKQKSQREERYRDRAEPWPLTFNCWGTPRQMKLPTDTDLEWLLQFSPVTGELTRRRGDSDYQLISRMTDLALLIWVLSVSLLFYFSGCFFFNVLNWNLIWMAAEFSANCCNILTRWHSYYDMTFNIYQMTPKNMDIHAHYGDDWRHENMQLVQYMSTEVRESIRYL